MTRDFSVEQLLRLLGIAATRQGKRWTAHCPNPLHPDRSPSWSIMDVPGERRHGAHFCFSCKFGGGAWELAAAVWRCTIEQAGARLGQELGNVERAISVPRVVITNSAYSVAREFTLPLGCTTPGPAGTWPTEATRYLDSRGVTREQLDRWHVGFALRGRLWGRIVFPVRTDGALRTYSARAYVDGLDRYDMGRKSDGAQSTAALWGEPLFDYDAGTVTVAEGIFSALALERAGAVNPCAMLGSDLTPERARILSRFRRVVIATDPDAAGDAVAEWIAVLGRRCQVTRLALPSSPDDCAAPILREIVASTFHMDR